MLDKNKNLEYQGSVLTEKDYFGPRSTFRTFILLLLSFACIYSLYSAWQIKQWTKKQRIHALRTSEQNLTDLSQWIIRASVASEQDFLNILKKHIKARPHIRQISFKYKNDQVFTASTDQYYTFPAILNKIVPVDDEKVKLNVSNGIIDFGRLQITVNSDYVKFRVWENWVDVTSVVSAILLMMFLIIYISVRKSFSTLRTIAVCGNQLKNGNYRVRVQEVGQGETLAAAYAVNQIINLFGDQNNTLSDVEYSMKSELEKSQEYSKKKEHAEIANLSKSEYLSKVSEEFRAPLNNILSLSEMLTKPEYKAQERHFMDMIHASAIQLHGFIDSVVDISKIETESITYEKSIFDFRDVMRIIKSSLEPLVAKQNKSFEMIVDSDVPKYLVADGKRIRQVVLSLICDMLTNTQNNAIYIKTNIVKTDVISVTVQISIYGRQTGKSEKSYLANKEESGQSTAESICNIYGNSGIGRVVTKKLIRAMEGKLDIKKDRERVQSYTVNLRLQRPSKSQMRDYDKVRTAQGRLSGKTLRVLLAESHLINRYIFELVFFHKGHVTIKAENGEEALEKMRKENIDFAILDAQMPVLDGLSVAKEWRLNEKKESYLPIIITSSDTRMESLQACEEFADFVESKPVSPYKLLEDIEMYLLNPTEDKRPLLDQLDVSNVTDLIDTRYFNDLKNRGNKEEISSLVNNFCDVFEDEFEKLKNAIDKGEINLYRTISQRLKGGTNTIGAKALRMQFAQMQTLESNYIVSHKDELIDTISKIYKKTKTEFQKAIS